VETLEDLLRVGPKEEVRSPIPTELTTALTDELEFYFLVQKDYQRVVELTAEYMRLGFHRSMFPINGEMKNIGWLRHQAKGRLEAEHAMSAVDLDDIFDD